MRTRILARKHLEKRLSVLRPVKQWASPPRGWLRAIREALGMTAGQLAGRMRVSQPRIFALEKAEARGAATIATLERAARALDCTFVYAFVPNKPLDESVRDRAREVARDRLVRIDHTMQLENQGANQSDLNDEIDQLTDELMASNLRRLWD